MNIELHPDPLLDPANIPERDRLLHYPDAGPVGRDACREAIRAKIYPREWLADTLQAYNRAVGNDAAALENCAALRDPEACVVVSGQQAGLFTGPMYTVFKAITTIKLAQQETERLGQPVIPVFWNATEDHDLSEIAVCRFPGEEWRADFPDDGRAAECLRTDPACEAPRRQLLDACAEFHRDELAALLDLNEPDYGHYSSAVLARLFAGTGLVILEPRMLRSQSVDFLTACCHRRKEIRDGLRAQAARLQSQQQRVAFSPKDGFGLFHIDHEGHRRQILEEGDLFLCGGVRYTEESLVKAIQGSPESFSTGAYLRPILQSLCLPNIAFVAGPGEYLYHLQLKPLYDLFQAVMPPLVLRNQATLLGPAESRNLAKLGLSVPDLFKDAGCFHKTVELPDDRAVPFRRAGQKLKEAADLVTDEAGDLVGRRAVKTFLHKSRGELEKVHKRAAREYQRRHEVDNARVDRLFQAVRPGGNPQERQINIFYFLQYRGRRLIHELIELFEPAETKNYVVTVESCEPE